MPLSLDRAFKHGTGRTSRRNCKLAGLSRLGRAENRSEVWANSSWLLQEHAKSSQREKTLRRGIQGGG